MLFDWGIEETLHSSMFACACNYVAIQSMLGVQTSWFEPTNVVWVVEHVLDGSVSLVNANRKAGQNNPLDYNAIGIGIED